MTVIKYLTTWAIALFMALPAATFAQQLPYQNEYAFGLDVSFVKYTLPVKRTDGQTRIQ